MEFIETICIKDGHVVNPDGHRLRMHETATHFGFLSPELPDLTAIVPKHLRTGITKCRILYSHEIHGIGFEAYRLKRIESFIPIEAGNLDYAFKYADRSMLEYKGENKKEQDEIIFLRDGFLTDTSFSNIVLRKGKKFVTPEKFLLNGTQRRYLLKSGAIKEESVHIKQLKEYDELILINAMMGLEDGLCFPVSAVREF